MENPDECSPKSNFSRRGVMVAALGMGSLLLLQRDVVGGGSSGSAKDRTAVEFLRAAERAGTCTAANATGVGLRGEYFAEQSWSGSTVLVRVDALVDFDPSMEWPDDKTVRPKSVRWSGWIKPPLSGLYRFHADAPNMQVLVARQPVAGNGFASDVRLDMAAGRFYPIVIQVSSLTGSTARIRLEWTAPHGARYVVPRALLHLPTETVSAPKA